MTIQVQPTSKDAGCCSELLHRTTTATTRPTHPMPLDTLLTTKVHGSVMEGLLILLPCQAKTLQTAGCGCSSSHNLPNKHRGWMLKPKSKQQKKWLMSNLPRYFMKHHELLGMSLIRCRPSPNHLAFCQTSLSPPGVKRSSGAIFSWQIWHQLSCFFLQPQPPFSLTYSAQMFVVAVLHEYGASVACLQNPTNSKSIHFVELATSFFHPLRYEFWGRPAPPSFC